jgi:hypothetical protein
MTKVLTAALIGGVGGVGGVALTAMLLSSPTAAAFYDGTSPRPAFLAHIHALRFPATPTADDAYVAYGHKICHAIEVRYPVATVQAEVETELGTKGYIITEADQFVTYAHNDLCPNAGR